MTELASLCLKSIKQTHTRRSSVGHVQWAAVCERSCKSVSANTQSTQALGKRKEASDQNTLPSLTHPRPQASSVPQICKAKMKFRVMSHFRSSAYWFVGAISEDQGVAKRAGLPRRVCLNDLHIVHGAVLGVCFHHSNSIHHAYTLTHTAKNGMLAIKPLGGSQGHKELAAVGVRPCIGHRENSSPWWQKGRGKSMSNPDTPAWTCYTSLGIERSHTKHPTGQPCSQGRLSTSTEADNWTTPMASSSLSSPEVKLLSHVRLCNPMDCSLPDSPIHGIFQARVLECIAISFSRGSSPPRDWTWVSCIASRCFTIWATRKAHVLVLGWPKSHFCNILWKNLNDHLANPIHGLSKWCFMCFK